MCGIIKKSIIFCLILLGSVSFAIAQEEGGFEAGVLAGYEFVDDNGSLDDDFIPYGVFLGKRIFKKWLLQVTYERADDVDFAQNDQDTDLHRYGVKAVYEFFPEMKWVPYLEAGIGFQEVDNEVRGYNDGVFSTLGLGWKHRLTDRINLLVEGRYLHDFENHDNDLAVVAGLSFSFGEKAVKVKMAEPEPTPAE